MAAEQPSLVVQILDGPGFATLAGGTIALVATWLGKRMEVSASTNRLVLETRLGSAGYRQLCEHYYPDFMKALMRLTTKMSANEDASHEIAELSGMLTAEELVPVMPALTDVALRKITMARKLYQQQYFYRILDHPLQRFQALGGLLRWLYIANRVTISSLEPRDLRAVCRLFANVARNLDECVRMT